MGLNVMLDTNAYSHLVNGDERPLDALQDSTIVYFSVFVLGELLFGFKKGSRLVSNLAVLNKFLSKESVYLIPATQKTAECFSEIKIQLNKQGTPIPSNDIWIAAHCLEVDATLVTYDRHFDQITGLKVHKI